MSINSSDHHHLQLSDGAVVVLRRLGQAGRPRLVLSHGNGLAIDGYRSFWSLLAEQFELVLFDMRNHGVNPTHVQDQHNFARMTQDLHEIWPVIAKVFGAAPTVGLFHSMSAIVSVEHLAAFGPACEALVLFDPPVYPPVGHPLEAVERQDMQALASRSRRRPEAYGSPLELAAQFSRRRAFSNWVPGAAEDLARATLRADKASGQWVLACPRDYEAHMYDTNDSPVPWATLTAPLPLPVLLLGGDPLLEDQSPPALLCAAMAAQGNFEYQALTGASHFLQIEQPRRCADAVIRFINTNVPACAV